MFFGKQEAKVQKLMLEHVALVTDAVAAVPSVIACHFTGTAAEVEAATYQVHTLEHKADEVRRQVQKALAGGAFLPFFREEYGTLTDRIDKIANRAVNFGQTLALEKPRIPAGLADAFRDLAQQNTAALRPFADLVAALFKPAPRLAALAEEVSRCEQKSDSLEWQLLKRVYNNPEIERAEQIVVAALVQRLAGIADAIENAADVARIIVAKKS